MVTTTNFFVGFLITHTAGQFPAAFDETAPTLPNRSWVAITSSINDLSGAQTIESAGLVGNWLIRADGSAFTLARQAAARARNRSPRFALAVGLGRLPDSELLEPLIDLVLHLRARRTPEGWEVHDLLLTGITQAQAAASLGVTPQAVSLRAQSARLRTEFAAQAALVRLLDAAGAPPEVG